MIGTSYFSKMKKIFLRNSSIGNEKIYMTCPNEGQSIDDFNEQNISKDFFPFWNGNTSEIKTEEQAAKHVDTTIKSTNGQHLYKNYKYPNDTVYTVLSAHESFISAVEALSELVGRDVDKVILFHN